MVETSENKWYVIRAVSGKESKIKDYIMTEISRLGFQDHIEEILVPTEKVIQIRNGKKINKEKVYFPGYIMIKANLVGEVPHIIRSVTNVIGFLGETKGGDPVPLRISEVNRMLGKVDELALNREQTLIPFVLGETIKVIDGPFNGFTGTVENINEEKRKLEVMVKIFGRKTPLELSYMQVEKIYIMAKEVDKILKLQVRGGAANPSPPVGPALGAAGLNIMEFCKQFNARTQDKQGKVLPVVISVFKDKSFEFAIKTPPAAVQLMEAAKVKKGSGEPNRDKVATVSWDQVKIIAEDKMQDLNAFTIESAMKMVAGTARSMGFKVNGKFPS